MVVSATFKYDEPRLKCTSAYFLTIVPAQSITYHTHNEIHIHMLNHIHYHHYHRHRLHFNSQLSTRCGQMSDKMATISPSQILTIRNRLPDKQ